MSDSRKPMIATGVGLLVVAAILLGLWFFSGDRASSDPAPSTEPAPSASIETTEQPSEDPTEDPTTDEPDAGEPEPSSGYTSEGTIGAEPTAAVEPDGGSESPSGDLPPAYVTDTPEAVAAYVPYVGGTMDFGAEVSQIIAPACLPSSYSDQNGTELEYSCLSSVAEEIVHFGVFSSSAEADSALNDYVAIKPHVSAVVEQADANNWVVLVGSDDALAVLEEYGYAVRASN